MLAGGERYLPHPAGQSALDYDNYLKRAVLLPIFSRTVASLAGIILRRPPTIVALDALHDHLSDVTMTGESLTTFARSVAHEVLTIGRLGILVDMPAVAITGTRPYWVPYRAEDIINWRTSRVGADPSVLTQLVLRSTTTEASADNPFAHIERIEFIECTLIDGIYRSRVWNRTPADHLRKPDEESWTAGDWITPTRRGTPLDFIPFVFVGPTGNTPDVARPPLLDLADLNLAHYRNSADREHGLFYVSLPTPWVSGMTGDQVLRIGPATAWRLGENGKAGMLEFSGAGIGAIERAMQEKSEQMAALGARFLESPNFNDSTATAALLRNSGELASLRTLASALGSALTQLLRWHEWWFRGLGDLDPDIRVDVADDLDRVRVSAEDVKAAMLAVQADLLSPASFYSLLESGGWTRPGVTAADEAEAVVAALRVTRAAVDDDDHDNDNDID